MSAKELMELHETLCAEARSIMAAKNHDYTSGSGDPYHNFRGSSALGVDPIVGVMLRMQDKMQRIKTFAEKGQLMVKGEGVEDAFRDLINYTVLAYGLSREERKSPGIEPDSAASSDPVRQSVSAMQPRPAWEESTGRAAEPASPSRFLEEPNRLPERYGTGRYG